MSSYSFLLKKKKNPKHVYVRAHTDQCMCGGQGTIFRRVVHTLLSSGFQGLNFGPRVCLKPSYLLSYLIDPIPFTLEPQLLTNLI